MSIRILAAAENTRRAAFVPPGHPGIATRLADIGPGTYDGAAHTVDCVLSVGSPVKLFYGTEVLKISPEAVILTRIKSGGIPLLDSHNQQSISSALGAVRSTWFNRGALMGKLSFHATSAGRLAEGMVARGEISGISAGYRVEKWEISDSEGRKIDPDIDRVRWDDDLTFTATSWELLEASLVTVPADSSASVRSAHGYRDRTLPAEFNPHNRAVLARMRARQNMTLRWCARLRDAGDE